MEEFKIIDAIDILLLATLLFYLYRLVRGTIAIKILVGILLIVALWKITEFLEMRLVSSILQQVTTVGIIGLIVVFQQEIRKFLLTIGSTNIAGSNKLLSKFKFFNKLEEEANHDVEAIIEACGKMAKTKTGALIILKRNTSLDFVKNTGDSMNIEVNTPIIESIFFKNSPLHDGALIIEDNRIVASRTILPVSNSQNIPNRFGLRHRAAIGLTEKTDALALIVSEETGQISYVRDGDFVMFENHLELIDKISNDLQ